ncbi:TraB/GumN family protein [Allobacillus halotolerans]|uniref:TraB/GumN family protein n=1 Tax=Allobacillus halotolerans TaxID=570278 RepID=A0ABS6GLT5_9BACI|nr:TraB/GumN family protein [Allobacillus halotolerans]MBU6079856.1 TraB/GumN family protein [Allobacillus halotolerans]
MKILKPILFLLTFFLLVACQSETEVNFADQQLEEAIRAEVDQPEDELYLSDVRDLKTLDLSAKAIEDLDGIEALESIEEINLTDNEITDVEPLTTMPELKEVKLTGNPLEEEAITELEENGIEVAFEIEQVGLPDGPGGFLWKVENGDTTVYLQGTVHLGEPDLFPMHEKIEQAYVESDVVVPEIDLFNVEMAEMNKLQMELGTYQDETNLEDHLPEETYQEVETFFMDRGFPMGVIDTYKPWLVSNMVSQLMVQELGFTEGVDMYFLSKAQADDKEIIALETPRDQLGIFADLSMDYQVQMLEESLIDINTYEQDLQQLIDIYKSGNVDDLLDVLFETDAAMSVEEEAYMEALNDNRNYGMAEEITKFLESGEDQTYFVIVGSLHLILEPHVISILEEEGYEVEHIH